MDFVDFFSIHRGFGFFSGCLKIHVIIVRQPPKLLMLDENINFVNSGFWPISPPWSIKFRFVRSVYCFLYRNIAQEVLWAPWSTLKPVEGDNLGWNRLFSISGDWEWDTGSSTIFKYFCTLSTDFLHGLPAHTVRTYSKLSENYGTSLKKHWDVL